MTHADTPDDTIRAQLAEYLRLNPDATAIEAVGHAGADPDRWVDVVRDALESGDPPAAIRSGESPETTGTDTDPDRSNPGVDTDGSGSSPNESGDRSKAVEKRTDDPDADGTDTPDAVDVDPDADLNLHTGAEDGGVLVNDTGAVDADTWADVDFSTTRADTYPPTLLEREQWMGRAGEDGKLPFAPWGDGDPDDAAPDDSPRWEWGRTANHVDGGTVALAEDDPRLEGRVFLQQEADPFAFVDGDDVRDPETGDVHPAFRALLEHLGVTYADVSTSGAGVHAYYHAPDGLPIDGKGQAVFDIDTEPWGANDAVPTVEIYANKHVCVTTGEHVDGTPTDLAGWDADALRSILEANGYADKPDVSHDTDRDRPDLEEYDPEATGSNDTADDVRDVLKAVDQLRARDLPLRSKRTGEDATGWETWDPSYRTSESGASVHSPPRESVFHDHKEGESYGLLGLFAAEEGIIRHPWDRLEGSDWWDAVDAARDAGAPIPSFDAVDPADTEPTAILPPSVRDLSTAASGWDWHHAGRDTDLSIDAVRDRTADALADAYGSGDRVLLEVLPTGGKTYGSVLAAARTGEPVTILTGRGRKEQYEQLREWCDEHGLTHYTLPSFTHDCETANGEHGEDWADTVRGWYNRGATPKAIHKHAEEVLGRPLPCQAQEGHRCTYAAKWDVDPDTDGSVDPEEDVPIDVLIGHYAHAHKPKVTTGRTVVFDEFPGGAYETTLAGDLQRAVSCWLAGTDGIPFDSYTDLLENRDDESRRSDALLWFDENGIDPDETHVFDDDDAHATAPLAAFTILAGEDLGNGYERADLGDGTRAVFNRSTGAVSILQPPAPEYSTGIVAMDGTPTKRMWELVLGERLNHRAVLAENERAEYVRDALNLNAVRTSEYVKPYNSPDHVHVDEDAALLEAIADKHGDRPGVITTTTALEEYDAAGVVDPERDDHGALTGGVSDGPADAVRWYGNVLGSNKFKDTRLGAVIGSNHYGDGFIKKWGAYAGETVERDGDGKGTDLSYTGFGGDVLQHMREHDTLQSVMRFGRDGNGAVVYVHTNTLPEWFPLAGEGRVTRTRSDGEREVLNAAADLEEWRTADLAEHPAVSVGERQVFNILNRLAERDDAPIAREYDGRGYTYRDDGIREVNDHGEVSLEPVDLENAGEETVREISRSSIYTWDFLNRDADPAREDVDPPGGTTSRPIDAVGAGDTPPDPGD